MVQQNTLLVSLLVMLVKLVDHIPCPPLPAKRGRPSYYSDKLFLKALVIMIVKHLHTPYELLCVLEQPTPEMQTLRALMTEGGATLLAAPGSAVLRRLATLPDKLPAQIGSLGCHLVALLQPWAKYGRAVVRTSRSRR